MGFTEKWLIISTPDRTHTVLEEYGRVFYGGNRTSYRTVLEIGLMHYFSVTWYWAASAVGSSSS